MKLAPFSPVFDKIEIGYERVLTPKTNLNLDIRVGLIAPIFHFAQIRAANLGGFITTGTKWLLWKNRLRKGTPNNNPLHGTYLKTEIAMTYFRDYRSGAAGLIDFLSSATYNENDYDQHVALASNLVFGRQIQKGSVLIDWYLGTGLAIGSRTTFVDGTALYTFRNPPYNAYSYAVWSDQLPITLQLGFRLGFAQRVPR